MVEMKNVCYKASKHFNIDNVSFSLPEGYMMCLLGENGSGKTTLLELMYGTIKADSGVALYNGDKLDKEKVALVGCKWCIDDLDMEANVKLLSSLYESFDKALYDRLLTLFNITENDRKSLYSELSKGQKHIFELAFAIARHPKVLLMDEPLSNLDPIVKIDLLDILRDCIEKENMTVIMSTHLIAEISDMVDYIGVLRQGKLIEYGDRETLFEKYDTEDIRKLAVLKEG